MIITALNLRAMAPNLDSAKAGIYTGLLNQAMNRFGIDTTKRAAFFMGQVLVESDDLTAFRENMNYSAERLMAVWPSRFKTIELARQYERNPQKLANFVYANRMGNGGPETNDGWNHRGAGWIQLTGKTNQELFATEAGIPLAGIGDYLGTSKGAAESACWYWWKHGINRLADFGNLDAVSDAINLGRLTDKIGDAEGYAKRQLKTNLCKKILGVL